MSPCKRNGHSSIPSRRESTGKYCKISPFSGLKEKEVTASFATSYDAKMTTFHAQKAHSTTKMHSSCPRHLSALSAIHAVPFPSFPNPVGIFSCSNRPKIPTFRGAPPFFSSPHFLFPPRSLRPLRFPLPLPCRPTLGGSRRTPPGVLAPWRLCVLHSLFLNAKACWRWFRGMASARVALECGSGATAFERWSKLQLSTAIGCAIRWHCHHGRPAPRVTPIPPITERLPLRTVLQRLSTLNAVESECFLSLAFGVPQMASLRAKQISQITSQER